MTLKEFSESKVGKTYVAICVHQYILWFQVSVHDVLVMKIAEGENNLCANELNGAFLESLLLIYVVVNVSSWQVFKEEINSKFILKDEIHRVYKRMFSKE